MARNHLTTEERRACGRIGAYTTNSRVDTHWNARHGQRGLLARLAREMDPLGQWQARDPDGFAWSLAKYQREYMRGLARRSAQKRRDEGYLSAGRVA